MRVIVGSQDNEIHAAFAGVFEDAFASLACFHKGA
jgi:hypothetical protein